MPRIIAVAVSIAQRAADRAAAAGIAVPRQDRVDPHHWPARARRCGARSSSPLATNVSGPVSRRRIPLTRAVKLPRGQVDELAEFRGELVEVELQVAPSRPSSTRRRRSMRTASEGGPV